MNERQPIFVSRFGVKYHQRALCYAQLREPHTKISPQEARALRLRPCRVCKPDPLADPRYDGCSNPAHNGNCEDDHE